MSIKILLFGGSGFVGKNILAKLEKAHYEILAPARGECDLLNYCAVHDYIARTRPDFVINAAGVVGGISANMNNQFDFLCKNAYLGLNIINAAKANNVKKLLNLACSCIYPANIDAPMNEAMLLAGKPEPTNEGYAIAKIAIVKACYFLSVSDPEFQYKTVIGCNLYGEHDNFSLASSHLVPAIIHKTAAAMQNDDREISVWGDGQSRREYMFAGDFANILLKIIKDFDAFPLIMNIGIRKDYTIDQFYEAIFKTLGYEGSITHDLSKPNGIRRKLLDTTLQESFGLDAETSLEDGIKITYDYYLKNSSENKK